MPGVEGQIDRLAAGVLDAVPHGICLIDRDRRIVFANSALARLISCPAEELTGKSLFEVVASCDRPRAEAWFASVGDETGVLETIRIRRCHAESFYADMEIGPRLSGDSARVISLTDITEKHLAREAERESRQRLQAHHDKAPLAMIEWRLDRSVRLWNPSAERIFGYTHEELASCDAFPLIVDEASMETVERVWAQLLEQSGGESVINTNRTKDGRIIQCHWYNCPLTDREGNVVAVASFAEDITETVRAQQELKLANERLRWVVNKLPVIVWAFDENLVPVLWNEHAERITGYSSEEIIGNPRVLELLYPDEAERLACVQGWAELDFGDYDEIERPVTCADGSVRRILWSNIANRCPMPGWRAWGIGVDVTDRHEAFVALRESEKRYRDIIRNVDLAGIIVDASGRVLFVNEFFVGLTGYTPDEVLGKHFGVFIEADTSAVGLFDFGDFRNRVECAIRTKAGESRTVVWTQSVLHTPGSDPAGACALGMDVTDHRRAQAELEKYRNHLEHLVQQRTAALVESQRRLEDAERLASMGRLAAGLSHDLGNMLLPVRCHLETIEETPLTPRAREALEAVRAGIDFLGQLGDGLALLGGQPEDRRAWCDATCDLFTIEQWWESVHGLLERAVPEEIAFETSFERGVPAVCAPRHLLTRAVLNLLVNASEALTKERTADPRIELGASLEDGRVVITVTDNGPGVSEDVARHAPEPFFTTKTRTLSTGLGLSVVDGFARRAGGFFELSPGPGGGAVARLVLPVSSGACDTPRNRRVAIRIPDKRLASLCEELLGSMGCIVTTEETECPDFTVVAGCSSAAAGADGSDHLIVVDPSTGMEGLKRALSAALGTEKSI